MFRLFRSSSGINFKTYFTYCFTVCISYIFCRTFTIGIPFCITKPESMSIWYFGGVLLVVDICCPILFVFWGQGGFHALVNLLVAPVFGYGMRSCQFL